MHPRRRALPMLPVALSLLAASIGGPAHAQPAPKAPPVASAAVPAPEGEDAARQAIKRGLAAFARGETKAALAEYLKAQELVPKANLPYRYAGEAYASLDQVEEAIASYEKYLAVKPDVTDADLVRARIEQLRGKLVGTVSVSSLPSGADVYLDDEPAPRGKTPLRLDRVARGPHRVVVRLGERRGEGNVKIVGGGEASVAVELAGEAGASPKKPDEASKPPSVGGSPQRSPLRTIGYVVGGVGLAGVLTGLVVDVAVIPPRLEAYDAASRRGEAGAVDKKNSLAGLQTIGLVGYFGGAALLATGTVLFLVGKPTKQTEVGLTPTGMQLRGSF